MKLILIICMALALTGCDSNPKKSDYEAWAGAVSDKAKYRAMERSAGVEALQEAVKSADPTTSLAAAISLGIVSAVQASSRQADQDRDPAPPRTLLDRAESFLLGAGDIASRFNVTNKSATIARESIRATVKAQRIQSEERLGTIDKIVDGGVRQTEAATKNPTNVTNITASGSATVAANGSTATRTEETNQIECTSNLTVRAGDVAGTETAGVGGTGSATTGSGTGAPGGNVTGGARSAPAAATQTQPCSAASGKK
jgi:hypothetical protein